MVHEPYTSSNWYEHDHWQTCIVPIGTATYPCLEEWLRKYSQAWVYQEEHDGIRILFFGRRHNPEWNTQITKENEAHRFMPIPNHPLRVRGPFRSQYPKEVNIGSGYVSYVEHPEPWQNDFMSIIKVGEPQPGIWWIQWHDDAIYNWTKFLGFMNIAQCYDDEKIHYLVRKRFGLYGKLRTKYFINKTYNSPVQVMRTSNPTLGTRFARRLLDARPNTIMILCSSQPCKGPHDDITFLTIDHSRHLVPATKYKMLS